MRLNYILLDHHGLTSKNFQIQENQWDKIRMRIMILMIILMAVKLEDNQLHLCKYWAEKIIYWLIITHQPVSTFYLIWNKSENADLTISRYRIWLYEIYRLWNRASLIAHSFHGNFSSSNEDICVFVSSNIIEIRNFSCNGKEINNGNRIFPTNQVTY